MAVIVAGLFIAMLSFGAALVGYAVVLDRRMDLRHAEHVDGQDT